VVETVPDSTLRKLSDKDLSARCGACTLRSTPERRSIWRMGGENSRHLRGCCAVFICLLTASAASMAELYRFEDGAYLGQASAMPDWAAMLERRQSELPAFQNCLNDAANCDKRYRGVRHVLEKARSLEPDRQISLINRYVNRKRYRRDRTERMTTALSDEELKYRSRWSTPGEFFRRGGDCEDYATTKYFLLRELGFSAESLRVVVTWDRRARGHHAILAVAQPDGAVWLLESDNRIYRRRHQDYRYIYSLNEDAVWDHETAGWEAASTQAPTDSSTPTEATL